MNPSVITLLEKLNDSSNSIAFSDTMDVIDASYKFTETAFTNGDTENAAGQNNGSCKLFAFAQLHQLNQDQTLALFGDFYRKDVLENPEGTDHANIRNFIQHGWQGIKFEGCALAEK